MIPQTSSNSSSPIIYNVLPKNIASIPHRAFRSKNYDNNYDDMLIYGSAQQEDEQNILMHFNDRQQRKIGYNSGSNIRNWKSLVNPQINHYYNQIMKAKPSRKSDQKQFCTPDLRPHTSSSKHQSQYTPSPKTINEHNEKNKKISLGNDVTKNTRITVSDNQNEQEKEEYGMDLIKQKYENKISVLEHQNNNLKDQLFYLRAAILAKYQQRLGDSGIKRNFG